MMSAETSSIGGILQRILEQIESATGKPTTLKNVDIEALSVAVQRAMSDCGEDIRNEGRVIELSSHTMGVLGDGDAARRLLVFGSGLVRASIWEFSGEDPLWILDLRKLVLNSGVQIEMAIFKSLSAVLDTVTDVWEKTSGRGRLGLRHVSSTAEQLLGEADDKRKKRSRAFSEEILQRCAMKLQDIAALRDWMHRPDVVNLD